MISVIVPVYNIAPYIERCVNSILNQTYSDLEVLLVDDGSTDATPVICDRIAANDCRVRVFHKKNGGVSSARNLALDHCRGEYISIIDGDDWIEPTLYEDAVRAMKETDTDVFMFEYFIDIQGNSQIHQVDQSCYGRIDREMAIIYSITPHNRFAWSKVFSSKLLLNSHLPGQICFDSAIILGEDTLFIEQVLLNCRGAYYSSKPYYHYDQREGSAIRSGFNERKLSGLQAYQRVCGLLHDQQMYRAEKYAMGALLNLGVHLGRCVAKCSMDVQREIFPQIEAYLRSIRWKVLVAKESDNQTRQKALLAILSLPMACKILNRRK